MQWLAVTEVVNNYAVWLEYNIYTDVYWILWIPYTFKWLTKMILANQDYKFHICLTFVVGTGRFSSRLYAGTVGHDVL